MCEPLSHTGNGIAGWTPPSEDGGAPCRKQRGVAGGGLHRVGLGESRRTDGLTIRGDTHLEHGSRLQVRMDATAKLIQGKEAREVWESLPLASQLTCGKTPPTGTVIKDSLAYEIEVNPDKFTIVRLAIDRMDVLHLGEMHRRALFQRNTGQFGQWCVP